MSKNPQYTLPIDAIFTVSPDNPLAYPAYKMGWKIGAHSSMKCLFKNTERWDWAFGITFLDCEYKKYNHDKHVSACKLHRPKYTTVRDLMTLEQCKELEIEYFDFDTIMKFAEDLEPHTENIIIIPKFECLSEIPKKYMLGYSFPSKYGATPLPLTRFAEWRIHLLGGSWKKQRDAIIQMGSDIVSFDNNNLWKISVYGNFNLPDGKTVDLASRGLERVTSPMYASTILSLGGIAQGLHELFHKEQKIEKVNYFF